MASLISARLCDAMDRWRVLGAPELSGPAGEAVAPGKELKTRPPTPGRPRLSGCTRRRRARARRRRGRLPPRVVVAILEDARLTVIRARADRRRQAGACQARDELIAAFMPLVGRIASSLYRATVVLNRDEHMQAGVVLASSASSAPSTSSAAHRRSGARAWWATAPGDGSSASPSSRDRSCSPNAPVRQLARRQERQEPYGPPSPTP